MTRHLAVAALVWGIGGLATAEGPAHPTMVQLIAQLGSDRFADREAAEIAIESLGSDVLPTLYQAQGSTNPEIRRRVVSLIQKLERSSDSRMRLSVKPLQLNYRNTPLTTALAELKVQSGLNLVLDPTRTADPLRPITCVTGDLPPWEALAVFCKAAGLREEFRAELDVPKPERQTRGTRTYLHRRRHHLRPMQSRSCWWMERPKQSPDCGPERCGCWHFPQGFPKIRRSSARERLP